MQKNPPKYFSKYSGGFFMFFIRITQLSNIQSGEFSQSVIYFFLYIKKVLCIYFRNRNRGLC